MDNPPAPEPKTERHSAGNLTRLTAAFDTSGGPVPTAEDLIRKLEAELDARVAKTEQARLKHEQEKKNDEAPSLSASFNVAASRALEQRSAFRKMMRDVPDGFRLVPVFYQPVSDAAVAAVRAQYNEPVRPRFLKFLAENHEKDLRALGIGGHGIRRMKNGLDPADSQNRLYDLNIDHIVEVAGGGPFSTVKEKDPDQPDRTKRGPVGPKFRVNHFGNFVLMPTQVHDYKNALNNMQRMKSEGGWMLMLAPERNDETPGFVAPPQKNPQRALRLRPDDPLQRISHAVWLAEQTTTAIATLKRTPEVADILVPFNEVARDKSLQAARLAVGRSRRVFDRLAANNPALAEQANVFIASALKDFAVHAKRSFNEVSADLSTPKQRHTYESFVKAWRNGRIKRLREAAENLPVREAGRMLTEMRRIDRRIREIEDLRRKMPREAPKTPKPA